MWMTTSIRLAGATFVAALAVCPAGSPAVVNPWAGVADRAGTMADPLGSPAPWEGKDLYYFRSPLSPGVVIRMKSPWIRFFGHLGRYGAEPPRLAWVKTQDGTRTLVPGRSIRGSEMTASWIVTSFQGSRGWEQFDVPWFISLEKRPALVTLSAEGLRIDFAGKDTGYVFSMPLYGYDKLPQKAANFAARFKLPSLGLEPWTWTNGLPGAVIQRCDWWAGVSKAYPAGFQESFRVDAATDEIAFRQDYRWLTTADDWGTRPVRFAVLPPAVGLAWKFPGFPMKLSMPIVDPGYFTAFGPIVGATETDRVEISMNVLQYIHELELVAKPPTADTAGQQALQLIAEGLKSKFPSSWQYFYDHGSRQNFCWNIVADVWYPRALPFAGPGLREKAQASLKIYMQNDVLRPHSPYHGKYLLHGPGIGSWGESGDAGKFMTNALQAIWSYAQFTGDWKLIRTRWDLIRRYFLTPDEADWVSYGRYAIAESGDEAAPCSAYARLAWAIGDVNEYLLGACMFSRELILLYIKQRAGSYFYEHQPYNQFDPMPPHIYPTDLWGSTQGWQVDGPTWGHLPSGEHQSANRWTRFQDPDTGRFYRDHLSADVRKELAWYRDAGREARAGVYRAKSYQDWINRDNPHILPSLVRLESLLTGAPLDASLISGIGRYRTGWGAADIAVGYSILRKLGGVGYQRLVPRTAGQSPFVLGLERTHRENSLDVVQEIRETEMGLEPRWQGWPMPKGADGKDRSFGAIEGDFAGRVSGEEGARWISYGCRVSWASGIRPRSVPDAAAVLASQDQTPVAIIGPFANDHDDELTGKSYPPETEIQAEASYPGALGPVSWRMTRLAKGRRLDLTRELAGPNGVPTLAYIAQFVWSPEDMGVWLLARHQGGIVAWINHSTVLRYHGVHRPAADDALRGLGRLKKGWNRILLKVESMTGDRTFQFRLVHLDGQPIPALKFSDHVPGALSSGTNWSVNNRYWKRLD